MSQRRRYIFIGAIVLTAALILCWGVFGAAADAFDCFYTPPIGNKPRCAGSGWLRLYAIGDAAGLFALA